MQVEIFGCYAYVVKFVSLEMDLRLETPCILRNFLLMIVLVEHKIDLSFSDSAFQQSVKFENALLFV